MPAQAGHPRVHPLLFSAIDRTGDFVPPETRNGLAV
jgi:hypothetical protein